MNHPNICVQCQGDDDALNVAGLREAAWERHPVEVESYTCGDCGYTRHWWYFQKSEAIERELRRMFHSLSWEPGDLESHEAERILMDVLADIWRDCYRQGNPAAQRQIFRERVRNAVKCATGDEGAI